MAKKAKESIKLGDLIAALYEETAAITRDRLEQNLLVYAVLRDLLKGRRTVLRPVVIRTH